MISNEWEGCVGVQHPCGFRGDSAVSLQKSQSQIIQAPSFHGGSLWCIAFDFPHRTQGRDWDQGQQPCSYCRCKDRLVGLDIRYLFYFLDSRLSWTLNILWRARMIQDKGCIFIAQFSWEILKGYTCRWSWCGRNRLSYGLGHFKSRLGILRNLQRLLQIIDVL